MLSTPYFLSLAAAFAGILIQLFAPKGKWIPGLPAVIMSALGFSGVVWAVVLMSSGEVWNWEFSWFSPGPDQNLFINLNLGVGEKFWFLASAAAVFLLNIHFLILRIRAIRDSNERTIESGPEMAMPFFSMGFLLTSAAGNVLTFCGGWSFFIIGSLLTVYVGRSNLDIKSTRTYRFFVTSVVGESILCVAALALSGFVPSGKLAEITPEVASRMPLWGSIALLVGIIFRQSLLPVTKTVAHQASARGPGVLTAIFYQMLPLGILFHKFGVLFTHSQIQTVAAIVGLASALIVVLSKIASRDDSSFVCYLQTYFSSIALAMIAVGSASSSEMVIAAAGFTLLAWMVLHWTVISTESALLASYPLWAQYSLGLVTVGVPFFGTGWSKFEWYRSLLALSADPLLGQILLAFAVFIGLLYSFSIWGRVRLASLSNSENITTYQIGVVLFFLPVALLPIDLLQFSPEDILPLSLVIGEVFVGFVVAIFWIYRDAKIGTAFVERWNLKVSRPIAGEVGSEYSYLEILFEKVLFLGSRILIVCETAGETGVFRTVGKKVFNVVTHVFHRLEHGVLERLFVQNILRSLNGVVTAVKFVHNGAVQFYFILGVLLTAAIIFLTSK